MTLVWAIIFLDVTPIAQGIKKFFKYTSGISSKKPHGKRIDQQSKETTYRIEENIYKPYI